jgi:hypothetical protein
MRYGRLPYTTIWSTGSSKFNLSYFPISQLPTTQLHHRYFHFSIFKVGALFLSPSLCEPLHASHHAVATSHTAGAHDLCEPLHALCRIATRSKGKGMLLHFTDGSLSDYFPL